MTIAATCPMTSISNVRLAIRSLLKRPAFSGMAVLILALGIGANAATFSVVNAVLLRSLPYGDPSSLVTVFADGGARGQGGRLPITAGDFAWSAFPSSPAGPSTVMIRPIRGE